MMLKLKNIRKWINLLEDSPELGESCLAILLRVDLPKIEQKD
jgi:hypothetical protein